MNAVLPVNLGVRPIGVISRHALRKCWSALPNEDDACLLTDRTAWDAIVSSGGLQKICCPTGRKPYANRPWIAMPSGGRRFKPIGILNVPDLANPANVGVDIIVPFNTSAGSLEVPDGWDGVITDVVMNITNSPFVEGSGDLTWRLSASQRYLRDMGDVITQLGSLTAPNPVPRGGLRVYSKNLITMTINFGANAPNTINPAGKILVSVTGWFYPRA